VRAVALAVVLLLGRPAGAVSQCGDQNDSCKCGVNNPYPCCSNGGNCTWWAWEAACCNWGVGLPGWGNANQWAGNAKANPKYEVKSAPVAGSIGVRVSGTYGHVVWVKSVSGSSITVSEMNCWGGYGMQTATYSANYFDGGFIVQKTTCACTAGQTQSQDCGDCGTKTRTCTSSCQWGAWSSCSGEGVCSAQQTETKDCGNCGARTRTCSSSCQWSAWSTCAGEGTCSPDATQSQSCGPDDGLQQRRCGDDCQWEPWGSCVSTDGGPTPDLGPGVGPDLGLPGQDAAPNGAVGTLVVGGCQVGDAGNGGTSLLLILLLLVLRRRC